MGFSAEARVQPKSGKEHRSGLDSARNWRAQVHAFATDRVGGFVFDPVPSGRFVKNRPCSLDFFDMESSGLGRG